MLWPSQLATCFSSPAIETSSGRRARLCFLGCRFLWSSRLLPHLLGCPLHRLDDVLVARAAADVARDRPADLLLAGIGVLIQQRLGDQHHPGSAEAALEPVLLFEARLYRVQLAARGEPFDGRHLAAIRLDGEERAGLDRRAVQQDRAGAAAGGVAADVGAGQPQGLPEEVDEQQPRLHVGRAGSPVDGDRYSPLLGPAVCGLLIHGAPPSFFSLISSITPSTDSWPLKYSPWPDCPGGAAAAFGGSPSAPTSCR